jgi:hypothetical protein
VVYRGYNLCLGQTVGDVVYRGYDLCVGQTVGDVLYRGYDLCVGLVKRVFEVLLILGCVRDCSFRTDF